MSVLFFYSKEKEKLKTGDYRDFIGEKHDGVEDENFSEFLGKSICNKDF